MKTILLVIVGACLLLPAFSVQAQEQQSGEQAAINKRVEGLYQALAKGDVKAYVAALHQDAVRAIGTNVAVGRPAIEKAVAAALAQGGVPIKFTRHATRLLSPTTAIVHGSTEDASTPPQKGHVIFTLVKEGNDWLIAAFQTAIASTP